MVLHLDLGFWPPGQRISSRCSRPPICGTLSQLPRPLIQPVSCPFPCAHTQALSPDTSLQY